MNEITQLRQLWWAGVRAVQGDRAVLRGLRALDLPPPDAVISIGKAAASMMIASFEYFGPADTAVLVTKHDHVDPRLRSFESVRIWESGHPIPDDASLSAGACVLDAVQSLPAGSRLLLLVSGGASSLAEVLEPDVALEDWQNLNRALLAGGLDIATMNQQRKAWSRLKGGKLLAHFGGAAVDVLFLSDVRGDGLDVCGSGIGDINRTQLGVLSTASCVADNATARFEAAQAAEAAGLSVVINEETLYDDVETVAAHLGQALREGPPGVYIWGGEPTLTLPDDPGRGGRNQHLALMLARELAGHDRVHVVVAGTDGTDGPTRAAGGLVDGHTWDSAEAPDSALLAANSGACLDACGALFVTGPTGTNVMDLVLAIKR